MGYNMGRVRWREFVKHVRSLESGVQSACSYGALKFSGANIYSYNMLIAKVRVSDKVVVCNNDANKRSQTTTVHLRGVLNAAMALTDWTFMWTTSKYMDETTVEYLQRNYGGNVKPHEVSDVLSFIRLVFLHKRREELIREYCAMVTQEERNSMRGLIELAQEPV